MKKILIGLFIIVCFSQCKVAFVPNRDDNMKARVIQEARTTDSLYQVMISSSDKSYATYSSAYAQIQNDIQNILSADSLRVKPAVLLSQIKILQYHFNYYVQQHQLRGSLTGAQLQTYELDMQAYWQPIIVSESSYK